MSVFAEDGQSVRMHIEDELVRLSHTTEQHGQVSADTLSDKDQREVLIAALQELLELEFKSLQNWRVIKHPLTRYRHLIGPYGKYKYDPRYYQLLDHLGDLLQMIELSIQRQSR